MAKGEARSTTAAAVAAALVPAAVVLAVACLLTPAHWARVPWDDWGLGARHRGWLRAGLTALSRAALPLAVSASLPEFAPYWTLHMFFTYVGASGGSSLIALLLGEPLPLLSDPHKAAYFLASWFLGGYTPVGAWLRATPAAKAVAFGVYHLVSVRQCLNVADQAARRFPGVWAAPLLLGSLASGTGGSLLALLKFLFGLSPHPGALWQPSFNVRRSVLVTAAYTSAAHFTGGRFVPASWFREYVLPFVAVHAALQSMGVAFDYTRPVFRLLYAVLRVPDPDDAAASWPLRDWSAEGRPAVPANALHAMGDDDQVIEQFLTRVGDSTAKKRREEDAAVRNLLRDLGDPAGPGDGALDGAPPAPSPGGPPSTVKKYRLKSGAKATVHF